MMIRRLLAGTLALLAAPAFGGELITYPSKHDILYGRTCVETSAPEDATVRVSVMGPRGWQQAPEGCFTPPYDFAPTPIRVTASYNRDGQPVTLEKQVVTSHVPGTPNPYVEDVQKTEQVIEFLSEERVDPEKLSATLRANGKEHPIPLRSVERATESEERLLMYQPDVTVSQLNTNQAQAAAKQAMESFKEWYQKTEGGLIVVPVGPYNLVSMSRQRQDFATIERLFNDMNVNQGRGGSPICQYVQKGLEWLKAYEEMCEIQGKQCYGILIHQGDGDDYAIESGRADERGRDREWCQRLERASGRDVPLIFINTSNDAPNTPLKDLAARSGGWVTSGPLTSSLERLNKSEFYSIVVDVPQDLEGRLSITAGETTLYNAPFEHDTEAHRASHVGELYETFTAETKRMLDRGVRYARLKEEGLEGDAARRVATFRKTVEPYLDAPMDELSGTLVDLEQDFAELREQLGLNEAQWNRVHELYFGRSVAEYEQMARRTGERLATWAAQAAVAGEESAVAKEIGAMDFIRRHEMAKPIAGVARLLLDPDYEAPWQSLLEPLYGPHPNASNVIYKVGRISSSRGGTRTEEGKVYAIVSYITIIGWIIALILKALKKDDPIGSSMGVPGSLGTLWSWVTPASNRRVSSR